MTHLGHEGEKEFDQRGVYHHADQPPRSQDDSDAEEQESKPGIFEPARKPALLLQGMGDGNSRQSKEKENQGQRDQESGIRSSQSVQKKNEQQDGQPELELADQRGETNFHRGQTPAESPEDGAAHHREGFRGSWTETFGPKHPRRPEAIPGPTILDGRRIRSSPEEAPAPPRPDSSTGGRGCV